MNDRQWDKQLVDFLKRTGEELKRTGEEVKREAQRLIEEVRDPETQAKMRDSVANFGTWAKKTAEEAAGMIDVAVQKAEDAFRSASSKVRGDDTAGASAAPAAAAPTPAAKKTAAPRAKKPAAKTMGRAKAGGSRKPAPTRAAKAKKTVGKKR